MFKNRTCLNMCNYDLNSTQSKLAKYTRDHLIKPLKYGLREWLSPFLLHGDISIIEKEEEKWVTYWVEKENNGGKYEELKKKKKKKELNRNNFLGFTYIWWQSLDEVGRKNNIETVEKDKNGNISNLNSVFFFFITK